MKQTAKIGSLVDVTDSADPEGLRVFYYLVQDLKALNAPFSVSLYPDLPPLNRVQSLSILDFLSVDLLKTFVASYSASNQTTYVDILQSSMPTHSDGMVEAPLPNVESDRVVHPSCPPEESRRSSVWELQDRGGPEESEDVGNSSSSPTLQQQTPPADDECDGEQKDEEISPDNLRMHHMEAENESHTGEGAAPLTPASDCKHTPLPSSATGLQSGQTTSAAYLGFEFSNARLLPTTCSSRLRAGSRFEGTQQSESQVYDVHVDIKYVDMRESFLCGYLRIQGLTEDHPTLTTYFEGEIIGNKYTFQTRHPEWGSSEKVDMKHWDRFQAYRPLAKQARKPDFKLKDFTQRENIFMRWKEQFLVPNHTVRTISGASFEGFYYICFNQVNGSISGIYFHAKSEK
ncbi:MAG: hypothetical protein M1814_006488 [Vezdaea aestivalis]|nr:MAG: hypothetical protein M1814_006488 [Vezdaea aestivalis]